MPIVTRNGTQFELDGQRLRFMGSGNYYPLCYTSNIPSEEILDEFFEGCVRDGVKVIRGWLYDNLVDINSDIPGNFRYRDTGTNTLQWREAQFQHVDRVLFYANKWDIKLILAFSDAAAEGMRNRYLRWHDDLYGTHYRDGQTISITSLTRDGTTVTGVTASPHELYPGCLIEVAGAVETQYNGGNKRIATVPDATTFTFQTSQTPTSPATGTITMTRGSANSPTKQSFFHVDGIIDLFKEHIEKCLTRVSTVDGIAWNEHPAVMAWEIMNEPRYDQTSEANPNTDNSNNIQSMLTWTEGIADYIRSLDPNHLIGFGDMARRSGSVANDQVFAGSYYGVDLLLLGALDNIDYVDAHVYPYQFNNASLRSGNGWYGVNASGGEAGTERAFLLGMRQLIHFAKLTLGKPFVITEYGMVKTPGYTGMFPNYPREVNVRHFTKFLYDHDCDGLCWWHYYGTRDFGADNNYGIQSQGAYPLTSTYASMRRNYTDEGMLQVFREYAAMLEGKRKPV